MFSISSISVVVSFVIIFSSFIIQHQLVSPQITGLLVQVDPNSTEMLNAFNVVRRELVKRLKELTGKDIIADVLSPYDAWSQVVAGIVWKLFGKIKLTSGRSSDYEAKIFQSLTGVYELKNVNILSSNNN